MNTDIIISERDRIWKEYCIKKGWPIVAELLSFEQILEIRALPEWINAGKNIQL